MKESDRKFEKLLKETVCSYHKEEMDALPSEEELQDIQLSDDFYRKMDGLVKKQKRRWQYRFVRYGAVAASFLLFMHLWERRISKHSLKNMQKNTMSQTVR